MLDLPQITLWVAGVFFHRFYMRYSLVQEKGGIHHYVSPRTAERSPNMIANAVGLEYRRHSPLPRK